MADSKLKNVNALKQMLDGNHRLQTRKTIGFSDSESSANRSKVREVGEVWEEKDHNDNSLWWEQRNGFRVKHHMHPSVAEELRKAHEYLQSFPNCHKEKCTCIQPTRIDEKFRRMMGLCEDCVISMETSLKIQGKFDEYAFDKMKANAESFFKQADVEVDVLKREIQNINFAGDETDQNNVVEKWSFQDTEAYLKNIDEKYKDFKEKTLQRLDSKK